MVIKKIGKRLRQNDIMSKQAFPLERGMCGTGRRAPSGPLEIHTSWSERESSEYRCKTSASCSLREINARAREERPARGCLPSPFSLLLPHKAWEPCSSSPAPVAASHPDRRAVPRDLGKPLHPHIGQQSFPQVFDKIDFQCSIQGLQAPELPLALSAATLSPSGR